MKKILGMPITVFVLGLLVVGGVTAALLTNFGVLKLNMTTQQAVLVDGQNQQELTPMDAYLIAGSEFCSMHTLLNQAEVGVDIELSEESNYDGISVEYNKILTEWSLTQDDFSQQSYLFELDVVNNPDGSLTITVTDKDEMVVSHPMGTITVFDENGNALYHVGYNTADGEVYKVYDNGWITEALPAEFVLSRTQGNVEDYFQVTIPANAIDVKDRLAFNIERIGYSSAVNARYPVNWAWQGVFEDASSRYGKTSLVNPFSLYSGESLHFERCYITDVLLQAGNYDLGTVVGVASN